MKTMDRIKGISKDLVYSVFGIAVMNGVTQLALYPYLQHELGAEAWGHVLSLFAIISIMGTTFGTGANYSRMLASAKGRDGNGDYRLFLAYVGALAVVVTFAGMYWMHISSVKMYFGYYLLMMLTVLRYYADVEFRLNIDYKRYCVFYLLIAAGYLLGMAVYPLWKSWILVMILGEASAVLYVKCRGTVLSGAWKKSDYYAQNMQSAMQLTGTQLLANAVFNSDRLLLEAFCGGTAVTVFYVATLIGKVVSLISTPLNGVLIGYLARYKGKIKNRIFMKMALCGILAGMVLTVICTGVSYVFVKLMYYNVFETAKEYLWIANAGQVFYFISGTLMVVLMRFADEKYQLYVNILYVAVFFVLAVPLTVRWGIWGMASAILISNFFRIISIAFVGEKFSMGKELLKEKVNE